MKISSQADLLDSPQHNTLSQHLSYRPARLFGAPQPSLSRWMSWCLPPSTPTHEAGSEDCYLAALDG